MENQEDKIKRLYEEGVLSKEEMETELVKMSSAKENKRQKSHRIWWLICLSVAIMAAVVVRAKIGTSSTTETLNGQTTRWEKVRVDGIPAIQARFFNDNNEILEVTYSPSIGFRFGLFETNGKQIMLEDGSLAGFSRILTQEMVDRESALIQDEEYIKCMSEEIGEEVPSLIAAPTAKAGYLYYRDAQHVNAFIFYIDKGYAKSFLLTRLVESNSSTDVVPSPGFESIDYKWKTAFNPDEFSKMIQSL